MKDFEDPQGARWRAFTRLDESAGADYKGRYFLVLEALGEARRETLELRDVRWNSPRTAARTIDTMSEVELRRRLRGALGRKGARRAS